MEQVTTNKPSKVQVVRYFRPSQVLRYDNMPVHNRFDQHQTDFYMQPVYAIAGNRGVTVIFDLDYETRKFTARYSVCSNDTFNKGIGYAYAQACEFPFEDTLGDQPLFEQFAFGIAQALDSGTLSGKKLRDYTRLHNELLDVVHERTR